MAKKLRNVSLNRQAKWFANHTESIKSGKYEPFWRVEDIPSSGIKVKIQHFNDDARIVHLLSMNELFMYVLIAYDQSITECYEQYAIPLETSLAIANELEVKHPVYSDSRIPIVQTIDFLCMRDDGSKIAFPVKQESSLVRERTAEKLAIQESFCLLSDIDYQLVSSAELKTMRFQNLERLYRFAKLNPLLMRVFKCWLPNFIGTLSDDPHLPIANILERSASLSGIPYARAAQFLYHAVWNDLLTFNWHCPLLLECAASDLELIPTPA
ncbi:MAG: TnsA endonuclease N-terminal domain-containing protein [Pseudomonadales bacterium]|nr:TnsA endonuclease N-terminal domain-containing protein [Pseudomonadales bacterium]